MKNNSRTRMRRMERTERIRSACIPAAYPYRAEKRQRQRQRQKTFGNTDGTLLIEELASLHAERPDGVSKGICSCCCSCCCLGCSSCSFCWLLLFLGLVRVRRLDCCGADPLCPPSPPHPRSAVVFKGARPSGWSMIGPSGRRRRRAARLAEAEDVTRV